MSNNWAPFNSVINSSNIQKEISERQSRITKPNLTNEQIETIENILIDSLNSDIYLDIHVFNNYHEDIISGIVTKIDVITKKITLNTGKSIYFYNIFKISSKNTCN